MTTINVFRFDASGCNGCDIEIVSTVLAPEYGVADLDLAVVNSAAEAHVMIVTGGGNVKTAELLKEAYGQLQDPKIVISMGTCANSLCVFKRGYNVEGPIDTIIPVNFFVIGCPPRPQNLARAVHAILEADVDHSGSVWLGPEGLRGRILHLEEKCTACGACANMCPCEAITLVRDGNRSQIIYDMWRCSFCGTCAVVCPEEAVEFSTDYAMFYPKKELAMEHGCMSRAQCECCDAEMHTEKQIEVVKERILENRPAYSKFQSRIDESVNRCPRCKADIDYVGEVRAKMADWVYEVVE